MPAHKRQHYVPRCHLKPFSTTVDGKTINLFNIARNKAIYSAAIKTQCASSYFYGKDLKLERALQDIEGKYSLVVKNLVECGTLGCSELDFLRGFSLLQYFRTDIALHRTQLAETEMVNVIFDNEEQRSVYGAMPQKELIKNPIEHFKAVPPCISDLKTVVLHNKTGGEFVTSDDPAIQLNRLYVQKFGRSAGCAGFVNAGLMLLLPLSPDYVLCSYDGDVYTCPDRIKNVVEITKVSDVMALNRLQFIKAHENIYFRKSLARLV